MDGQGGSKTGVFDVARVSSRIARLSKEDKDLEILVLRKQLAMAEARLNKPVRLPQPERLTLAVITVKLKTATGCSLKELRDVIHLVWPATVVAGTKRWSAGSGLAGTPLAGALAPVGKWNTWW
jgi:hypothetical protein